MLVVAHENNRHVVAKVRSHQCFKVARLPVVLMEHECVSIPLGGAEATVGWFEAVAERTQSPRADNRAVVKTFRPLVDVAGRHVYDPGHGHIRRVLTEGVVERFGDQGRVDWRIEGGGGHAARAIYLF